MKLLTAVFCIISLSLQAQDTLYQEDSRLGSVVWVSHHAQDTVIYTCNLTSPGLPEESVTAVVIKLDCDGKVLYSYELEHGKYHGPMITYASLSGRDPAPDDPYSHRYIHYITYYEQGEKVKKEAYNVAGELVGTSVFK